MEMTGDETETELVEKSWALPSTLGRVRMRMRMRKVNSTASSLQQE